MRKSRLRRTDSRPEGDGHYEGCPREKNPGCACAQHDALSTPAVAPASKQEPRSWRQALLGTALKRIDDAPCWCPIDWRGLRPSNHGEGCERLTALLHEMIKEEEKTP